MHAAVMAQAPEAAIVVMAAAVADYTPRARAAGKVEKTDGPLSLELVRTRDILAELGSRPAGKRRVLVGFAAESGDPVRRGREKLERKQADMIVANDISRHDSGFDADNNAVTLLTADGEEPLALAPKAQIAGVILDRAEQILTRVAVG